MGSTSEICENETSLVVYVANENARLQSRPRHYQSQPDIICENVHSIDDDHAVANYDRCTRHGSSAVTVTSYDVASQKAVLFEVSSQNDSCDSCAINGENMRDNSNFDSCSGENCYTSNVGSSVFVNEKPNDSTVNTANQEPFVRSESVRSVDSVASGCSSLSSSSVGGNSKSLISENFSFSVNNSNEGVFNDKQTVAFSPNRVFPFTKDANSAFEKSTVSVPFGWKRLLNNGAVIYISPSNTVLNSLEQVNSYLLTDGNCFCGLDCPLYSHAVFNFDPEVVTSSLSVGSSELSKHCSHNRKRNVSGVIPASNLHPSCERKPSPSPCSNHNLVTNYCNPTVIKKYGFDISDRRKRKKNISSRDSSIPSSSVMVRNSCDSSAKENNSIINSTSQFGNGSCDQQLKIRLSVPGQQLTTSTNSMIRLKPNNHEFISQPAYYDSMSQSEDFNLSNEYFPPYSHNRSVSTEQSDLYVPQNKFHGAANSSGCLYEQVKSNTSRQQSCINMSTGQHHRISCSLASQPHRMTCDEGDIISSHHHVNSPQHQSHIPSLHMPGVSQSPFQQPLLPPPPQSQAQHHVLSQAGDFQPMRMVQTHPSSNSINSSVAVNGQVTTPVIQDDKFTQQTHQHTCLTPQKIDKPMCHMLPESNYTCEMQVTHCRMVENTNSFCDCYHEDNRHSHHQPSSCSRECANNCSTLMVPNSQNQTINHNLVAQPSQMRPLSNEHHGINVQKSNRTQQLYSHHRHFESQPQPQMHLHQSQHLLSQQPQQQIHHHHHRHHHQPQLIHVVQNQNSVQNVDMNASCSNQATSSGENDIINRRLHYPNANRIINPTSTRTFPMCQQKNVNRVSSQNIPQCSEATSSFAEPISPYDRVPSLHNHVLPSNNWNEESSRKKYNKGAYKLSTNVGIRKQKTSFNQSDVRSCQTTTFKGKPSITNTPVPSFLEDPSGYLAQQTALLNSTISKQTGENSIACSSQVTSKQMCSGGNQGQLKYETKVKTSFDDIKNRLPESKTPDSSIQNEVCHSQVTFRKNSTKIASSCQSQGRQDEEITSSTFTDKEHVPSLPRSDSKSPIQAGTVSTSHQSPLQPRLTSPIALVNQDVLPQSPRISGDSEVMKNGAKETNYLTATSNESGGNMSDISGRVNTTMYLVTTSPRSDGKSGDIKNNTTSCSINNYVDSKISGCIGLEDNDKNSSTGIDTSYSCNRINNNSNNNNNNNNNDSSNTSSSSSSNSSSGSNSGNDDYTRCFSSMEMSCCDNINVSRKHSNCNINKDICTNDTCNENTSFSTIAVGDRNRAENDSSAILSPVSQIEHITKSPLEMVQNVVSSIQIPSQNIESKTTVSQNSIQTSHFLLSNNGQLLVATSSNPQPMSNQQNLTANSSVVTNTSGSMTQMLPAVGVTQQVLSQPTVLVNTLPSGQLVFQPGVMAMDSAGNTLQIPQLTVATASNMLPNQALTEAGAISVATGGPFSPRGPASLLSPESSKRKHNNKKRKLSPQHMLQITQSNSQTSNGAASVVVQPAQTQHSFTQPAPVLQTLILPNKNSQFTNAQSLLTTTNVLQPVNLVHNIPTIQQFIVPAGLGGMVMTNGDGTATILPEAVQLNVLTPVQNTTNATMFGHAGNQNILAASSTAGMVIRTQSNNGQATVNAQLRPQTISTTNGAQFIAAQSPNQFIVNNSPSFNSQLSPIVANVSPSQQIHSFNTSSNTSLAPRAAAPQEYNIQCVGSSAPGQTLMVPCSVSQNASSPQNTTVVQQNTTIVQQQMTMVSNNQQLPENSSQTSSSNSTSSLGLGQHNIILNDNKHSQNFFITTDNKSTQPQTGFILSPKNTTQDKQASAHFFFNSLNSEKQQSPSFIISNPSEKELCGNFILANTSEKSNGRGNLIIAGNQATPSFDRQINRFSKHSVSTQTGGTAATTAVASPQVLQISSTPTLIVATNNTYSQNNHTYSTSPPDTTTHSPVGANGSSPEMPSSSFVVGSTDDVASPSSSTSLTADLQTRQPMVHCISSSSVVDWAENGSEEKKINIIVDRRSSEMITGIDVFSPMSTMQSFQRRSSTDSNENISFIGSSTFDDSAGRK